MPELKFCFRALLQFNRKKSDFDIVMRNNLTSFHQMHQLHHPNLIAVFAISITMLANIFLCFHVAGFEGNFKVCTATLGIKKVVLRFTSSNISIAVLGI